MRRGTFEEREGSGGEKSYRLTWEPKHTSLSPKEVLSGLFIRYLISRGKLSEFMVPHQTGSDIVSGPTRPKRKPNIRQVE